MIFHLKHQQYNNKYIYNETYEYLKNLFKEKKPDIEHLNEFLQSTFGKVLVAIAGGLEYCIDILKKTFQSTQLTLESYMELKETLVLASKLVEDSDNAAHFAQLGGHIALLNIMSLICDEEIQDLCSQLVALCSITTVRKTKYVFPFRKTALEYSSRSLPLIFEFPSLNNKLHEEELILMNSEQQNNLNKNILLILIRQVPARMTGQPTTGYCLWGGGYILCRWIYRNRNYFYDKNVLEVGSGLGLAGNLVANYAKTTILSDYNTETIEALQYNIDLNNTWIIPKHFPYYYQKNQLNQHKCVSVRHLDWDCLDDNESNSKISADVIIASDVICEPSTAEGFISVLRQCLCPTGVAFLINANSKSRFGVEHLLTLLQDSQFDVTIQTINDMEDSEELMQDVHDSNEVVYDFYTIKLRT